MCRKGGIWGYPDLSVKRKGTEGVWDCFVRANEGALRGFGAPPWGGKGGSKGPPSEVVLGDPQFLSPPPWGLPRPRPS